MPNEVRAACTAYQASIQRQLLTLRTVGRQAQTILQVHGIRTRQDGKLYANTDCRVAAPPDRFFDTSRHA